MQHDYVGHMYAVIVSVSDLSPTLGRPSLPLAPAAAAGASAFSAAAPACCEPALAPAAAAATAVGLRSSAKVRRQESARARAVDAVSNGVRVQS